MYLMIYPLGWDLSLFKGIFFKHRRLCFSLIDWLICNGAYPGKSDGHKNMLDVTTVGRYYICLILYHENFIVSVPFTFFRSMSDWEFVAVGVNSCSFLYWLSKPAETWHITQGIDSKSSISWGNNTDIKPEIKFLPLSFFKLELTAGFLVYV